jgi:hypothetical protein
MTRRLLSTVAAATIVPLDADATWGAVRELVAGTWPREVLHAQPGRSLLHAVAEEPDGEPQCWLSWTLEPLTAQATKVVLVHSELGADDPAPELDLVLLALLRRCLTTTG